MASTNPLCGEEVETYLWLHHRPIICIVNLVVTECGVKTFGLGHSKKGCVGAQVVCIAGTSGSHNEPQSIGDLPFANPPGSLYAIGKSRLPHPTEKFQHRHGATTELSATLAYHDACHVALAWHVMWGVMLHGASFYLAHHSNQYHEGG